MKFLFTYSSISVSFRSVRLLVLMLTILCGINNIHAQSCNAVANGDFAAGNASYSYITSWVLSGNAYNVQDGANNDYFKQSVTGLNEGPVANQVTLTFDVLAQNANSASGNTSASLVFQLNGITYLTISNPTGAGAVTATTANGATLSNWTDMASPNTLTTRAAVKLTIPWVSKPNMAEFQYLFSSSNTFLQGGDDFGVDNIIIDGPCPNPPCPCGSATSCNAGIYANQTAAFAAYDVNAITQDLIPNHLRVDGTSKSYQFCYTYTTGPTETQVAIRHLATAPSSCTVSTIAYSICSGTGATFVGANTTGGTRNFQFYNVQPSTTYRFCRTLTYVGGTPCATNAVGTSEPIVSSQGWYIFNASPPAGTFTFNCGTASVAGTFTSNNLSGQTGTLTVPLSSATAGIAIFNVSGTGFTGTLTTTLTAGQTSVAIPITYDGTGAAGSRTLTVTSGQGSGTCTKAVTVTTPPTTFTYPFNCTGSTVSGVFIANAVAGQTGTVTIPINITSAGSATITVTGTNISGTLTTTLVAGQSSVTIPITYTGAGTEGSRVLTISSTSGTGTCSVSVPIQAACKADGGRIGN